MLAACKPAPPIEVVPPTLIEGEHQPAARPSGIVLYNQATDDGVRLHWLDLVSGDGAIVEPRFVGGWTALSMTRTPVWLYGVDEDDLSVALVLERDPDGPGVTTRRFEQRVRALSPDGQTALVQCDDRQDGDCLGVLAGDHVSHQVPVDAPGASRVSVAAWPRSGAIVFIAEHSGRLLLFDPDSLAWTEGGDNADWHPAVSADGSLVLGIRGDDVTNRVMKSEVIWRPLADPAAIPAQVVIPIGEARCVFVADSLDTALCGGDGDDGSQLWTLDLGSRESRLLSADLGRASHWPVSENGAWVAVTEDHDPSSRSQREIVAIEIATGRREVLVAPGADRQVLAWLP